MNVRRGVVLHHFNFQKPVKAIGFSPDGKYIAVTRDSHVQVWKTPNHLVREFAPFVLHRTYTGHHDEVTSIETGELQIVDRLKDVPANRSSCNCHSNA